MAQRLSFDERARIEAMRSAGVGVGETARRLGRDPSTVYRELKRNGSEGGYDAVAAWPIMSPPGGRPPLANTAYQLTPTMAASALPAASQTAASRRRWVRRSSTSFSPASEAGAGASAATPTGDGPVGFSASASMGQEASRRHRSQRPERPSRAAAVKAWQ